MALLDGCDISIDTTCCGVPGNTDSKVVLLIATKPSLASVYNGVGSDINLTPVTVNGDNVIAHSFIPAPKPMKNPYAQIKFSVIATSYI